MGFADIYLKKQKGFTPEIQVPPSKNLRFIVVIPAFCEPDILDTLQSLWNCQRPQQAVEVIIVFNSPENIPEDLLRIHRNSVNATRKWISEQNDAKLQFHMMDNSGLSPKEAGAGLARKTGMDEAIARFNMIDRPDGFILSLDADSRCDLNYLTSIEQVCKQHKKLNGFTVRFAHPIDGAEFDNALYEGIIYYELHLRYVKMFLRDIGFPYAYHTIGSCFGVNAKVYAQQGGMNKRKAGEDFYFLHKVIPLGHFAEIQSTCVMPSPRPSMRVPFGTGPVLARYLNERTELRTYNPVCFQSLGFLFSIVDSFYQATDTFIDHKIETLPEALKQFLLINHAHEAISEINANSGSVPTFMARFYRWFDAFRVVKYLNYASCSFYPKIPVTLAVRKFLHTQPAVSDYNSLNPSSLLYLLRQMEMNTDPVRVPKKS